jgi:ribosomal protein S18 acetylase RimI-like enzyme
MRESDIEFVYTMCSVEEWNHSRRSVERLFGYEPNGCFVAEIEGRRVGHVFSFSYGKVGWVGMLIVDKEYRRRSVGTVLMKRAMSYLLDLGVETIKLEAVPEISSLYRRLGFIYEFDSLRFERVNKKDDQSTDLHVRPIRKNEITKIAEFDQQFFGADRTLVLSQLYEDNPELCFISHMKSEIIGYIMCYEVETGYRIGPWICTPRYPSVAKELILKCTETIGANAKLYVGVPAVNEKAVKILHDLDFEQYSKSIRMYYGKKIENERVEGIFSIGGPENG